jgi:hypothetical protein
MLLLNFWVMELVLVLFAEIKPIIWRKISKLNNLYFYPTPFTRLQWLSAVGCIGQDCGSQK